MLNDKYVYAKKKKKNSAISLHFSETFGALLACRTACYQNGGLLF